MKGKTPNLRTWGFVAGGAALLALLTLVLCLLGGVFDFAPGEKTDPEPDQNMNAPVLPASPTPMQTLDPAATPRPTEAQAENWHNISVVCGAGGTVSPGGLVQVVDGESVTLRVTPDEGYEVKEMKADGAVVPTAESYTFSGVTANHSFYVVFRALPEETEPPAESTAPDGSQTPVSPTDIG